MLAVCYLISKLDSLRLADNRLQRSGIETDANGIRSPVLYIAIHQPAPFVVVDPYQPEHRAPLRQIEGTGDGAPGRRGVISRLAPPWPMP